MTPEEQRDAKAAEDARQKLLARMRGKKAASPVIRFTVLESGEQMIEAPEGVPQAEAEVVLIRSLLRYLLD